MAKARRERKVLTGSQLNGADQSIAGWAGVEVPDDQWDDYVELVGGVRALEAFFATVANGNFEVTEEEDDMSPGMNDTYWAVTTSDPEALRAELRARLTKELNLPKTFTLIGADGRPFQSAVKGRYGGVRNRKVYGELTCPSARRAIEKGGPYAKHRVFFADLEAARAAGYRPCFVCRRDDYKEWKARQQRVSKPSRQ